MQWKSLKAYLVHSVLTKLICCSTLGSTKLLNGLLTFISLSLSVPLTQLRNSYLAFFLGFCQSTPAWHLVFSSTLNPFPWPTRRGSRLMCTLWDLRPRAASLSARLHLRPVLEINHSVAICRLWLMSTVNSTRRPQTRAVARGGEEEKLTGNEPEPEPALCWVVSYTISNRWEKGLRLSICHHHSTFSVAIFTADNTEITLTNRRHGNNNLTGLSLLHFRNQLHMEGKS